MDCCKITKSKILIFLVSVMLGYAGVIALRGNVNGKNMLLWILLSLVIFSLGFCLDGSCPIDDSVDGENFVGGCGSCGSDAFLAETMVAGKPRYGSKPMKTKDANKNVKEGEKEGEKEKEEEEKMRRRKHEEASERFKRIERERQEKKIEMKRERDARKPRHRLYDNKHSEAMKRNKRDEKRGITLPSVSNLMDTNDTPVTININYNSEIDSDNIERNSNNRKKIEVHDVMNEINRRNIYPGGGAIVEPCYGDNCVDNRVYNGYCNKGAYQLAQMQREILNLKNKYAQMAYLNDNPYMPMNQDGNGKCSVCPLESNGQYASFEGLKKMAEDEPYINPMMPGVTNRWINRGGNNDLGKDDYIPT